MVSLRRNAYAPIVRLRSLAVPLLCLTVLHGTARADDATLAVASLELTAAEGCIDAPALAARVGEQLEREAIVAEDAELIIAVRIEPTDGGRFRADLTLRIASTGDTVGTRAVVSDGSDCRSLDDLLTVIIGMLLNVRRDELPLPPPPEPEPEAPVAPPPASEPVPQPTPVAVTPIRFRGALGLGATFGLLPYPGVETTLEVGVQRGRIGLGLELAYDVTATKGVQEGDIHVQAASARVVATPILIAGDSELALRCALGTGLLHARTSGFDENRKRALAFFEVRAGFRFTRTLVGPLALELLTDIGVLPAQPTFYVRNEDGTRDRLYSPGVANARLAIGLVLRTN